MQIFDYKNIYMIGIGGVSMSGIAAILKNKGYNISRYDDSRSYNTDKLNKMRIRSTIGTVNEQDLENCQLVVFSAAISNEHPVYLKAQSLNKILIERADFLGELTKLFKDTICISGTHGKTTTTSMISSCFIEANLDPSIQVGAYLSEIDGNYRIGNSNYFIIESCEFHESFLKFYPKSEIILNIDNDHLDYYKNLDNIKSAFYKFANKLPNDGVLIYNGDDINSKELKDKANCKILTFGIENTNCNYVAKNITFDNGYANFDVYCDGKFLDNFSLSVYGKHNVYNALSCIALCKFYGLDNLSIKNGLLKFKGASRRFEYKGMVNGAKIYDDYAHHPTEIEATAKAMKNLKYNKSYVIFQPHTYSRTLAHSKSFANSLKEFDNIILLDIYAAREKNPGNISSLLIAEQLKELGKDCIYMPDFKEVENYIRSNIQDGDILITLGAGNVTTLSDILSK